MDEKIMNEAKRLIREYYDVTQRLYDFEEMYGVSYILQARREYFESLDQDINELIGKMHE